jgi:hypothetical protein
VARIGITVVKRVLFRGVQQEFSNTYYYQRLGEIASTVRSSLIDELVASEKSFHSSEVTFVRAAMWSADGGPTQNAMLLEKDLSGTGSGSVNANMDRERAVLIRWPAGKDIRGRPVYLRKWYHSCGGFGPHYQPTSAELQNVNQIPAATRTTIANAVEAVRELGVTETIGLCSKNGREAQPTAECHAYLEHHQLGDQWR